MQQFKEAGLLSAEPGSSIDLSRLDSSVVALLEQIGITQYDFQGPTALDQLANALWEHLQYREEDQDMVALKHIFHAEKGAEKLEVTAEIMLLGDKIPHGTSAMARTVGAPAALATHYVLQNDPLVYQQGVMRPLNVDLSRQFLKDLDERFNIRCPTSERRLN